MSAAAEPPPLPPTELRCAVCLGTFDGAALAAEAAGVRAALAAHSAAGVIELSDAVGVFCGFADAATDSAFKTETQRLLHYQRSPFCMMEGSNNAPLFSQCCSPRKPGDKFFPCMHGFDPPDPLPACTRQ